MTQTPTLGWSGFLPRAATSVESFINRVSIEQPRLWTVFVVLTAVAISLFSRFPAYADLDTRFPGNFIRFPSTPTGQAIDWWLNHPLQAVPIATFFPPEKIAGDALLAGSASHADKLAFRAFLPFVNRVVNGGVWTLIIANHLAAVLIPLLIYCLCLGATKDAVVATASTWAYGATWAGAWGFNDVMFGDAVALALLIGATAATRPWLIAIMIFAAGFTDERAVVAAPLVALFHTWRGAAPFTAAADGDRRASTAARVAPFLGMIGYVVCRCAITWSQNLHAGTSMMGTWDIFLYHFYASYPAKLFKVFEFLWLMPVLLFFGLWTSQSASRRSALLYLVGMLAAAAPAFVVWDVDRSLCYLLPGIVAAICFSPVASPAKARLALAICAASLLWIEPNTSVLRYFVFR